MTDQHDRELQALFDGIRHEFIDDEFTAQVMAGVDTWETTDRAISLLQKVTIVFLPILLFAFFGEPFLTRMQSSADTFLAHIVEGPWLLATLIVAIAGLLIPNNFERAS